MQEHHIKKEERRIKKLPTKCMNSLKRNNSKIKKNFEKIKEAAKVVRNYLRKHKKETEVMTSGKSGLHLYYSIRRGKDFDEVKNWIQ